MAQHRHKRDTDAPRIPVSNPSPLPSPTRRAARVAAPIAAMATFSVVGFGVLAANPQTDVLATSASGSISSIDLSARDATVSRSASRTMGRRSERALERFQARERAQAAARATREAVREADTRLWTTTALDLWTAPGSDAHKAGLLEGLERVLVTGRKDSGRTEVVIQGESRWVTSGYLVADKPKPEPAGPTLGGTCTNGTSVPSGVSPNIAEVHQVVCANFPQITSYGTFRSDGEHGQGRAIDIMVSGSLGWEIAEFLRANYSALGIEYIIYSQKIWSVERSSEGWRWMSDRGSVTANHYDHVHVTTSW